MNPPQPDAGGGPPRLSVVILSWNTCDHLRRCLDALRRDGSGRDREVLVVDNASADDSADMVEREFPEVELIRGEENLGYAAGNNLGAQRARGRWVCFLGSDTEVRSGALVSLTDLLERTPAYGAVAPRLVDPKGAVQRAGMRFPGIWTALTFDNVLGRFPPGNWIQNRYYMRDFDHLESRDLLQPPGTCFVMGREEFLAMGGFDPKLFLFFNDVDLCRRLASSGRRIRYHAQAEVMHHGGVSTGRFGRMVVRWQLDRLAYYRKWFGRWVGPLVKLFVLERGLEEWFRLRDHLPDRESRRTATRELRLALKEVMGA